VRVCVRACVCVCVCERERERERERECVCVREKSVCVYIPKKDEASNELHDNVVNVARTITN
jgi:hypothetical protein